MAIGLTTTHRLTTILRRFLLHRAAGTTFNEIIFREVTVTASTPVEVLVLSKYDVFHRLSRAAREALRTAAHSHAESVVYLDRFHKTDKWHKYKQRVLKQHVNHERLARILPQTPRPSGNEPKTTKKTPRRVEPQVTGPAQVSLAAETNQTATHEDVMTLVANKNVLVDANEFLLLAPHDNTALDSITMSTRPTIGHFVATFNADAPPSAARKKQLKDVLVAERRRQVAVLNEGNPLAYFDLHEIKQQEKRHHAEARGRAASTRRTLLIGNAAALAAANGGGNGMSSSSVFDASLDSPLPSPISTKAALVDKVARTVMNQFAHENFVFSRPTRPQDDDGDDAFASRNHHHHHHHHRQHHDDDSSESEQLSSSRRTSLARKERAEQLCDGEFVVISVHFPNSSHDPENSIVRSLQSPLVRVIQAVDSLTQAREIARRAQVRDAARTQSSHDSGGVQSEPPLPPIGLAYYLVPKKKYAVVPRSELHAHGTEDRLQRELYERFTRSSILPASAGTPAARSGHGKRPSVAALYSSGAYPERPIATAPVTSVPTSLAVVSAAEASGLFTSFQKIEFSAVEQHEIATGAQDEAASLRTQPQGASAPGSETQANNSTSAAEPVAPSPPNPRPRLFAVVSVILSRHEIENAAGDEPFLCVHQLFASEMQAMDAALTMTPQHFRNVLVCVLPVDEPVHLEDAYDHCIQVESDRREKCVSASGVSLSPKRNSRTATGAGKAPQSQPHRRISGATSRSPGPRSPSSAAKPSSTPSSSAATTEWQAERDKAHRLHQFICSRLGQKATLDKERREQQETTGFTPKALLTLDEKLATLHEYLESSNAAAVSARGGGGAHALGKYRQMKRFGSIMKARLGSTLATSGLSVSLLTSSSTASSTASTPVSPGVTSQPASPLVVPGAGS